MASKITFERFFRIFAWPTPVFTLLHNKEIKMLASYIDNIIVDAIESYRKRNLITAKDAKHDTGLRSSNAYIDDKSDTADRRIQKTLEEVYKSIQKMHPRYSDIDMIYQVRTVLAAGTETTRVTLSACILALAAHPNIQEKLYSEIVTVTGTDDCDVTPEHVRSMPYLDQVLKETLRRFLPVPIFSRIIHEDLKLIGWTIPAGSLVAVPPIAVHYNPKFYPDPERFDPDRFSPENVAARGNHSFIGFGSGPRICIGKVYAVIVLKIFLIHVLKKYKFSTTVDINSERLCGASVVAFKDGYKVEVMVR